MNKRYSILLIVLLLAIVAFLSSVNCVEQQERVIEAKNEELKKVTGDDHADIHNMRSRITTDEFIADKHPNVMKTPQQALEELHQEKCKVGECK
jgi:regulator of protease activity HflC (stomatin/prohibitin superfamily)